MLVIEIGNPDDCNDVAELRQWVRALQEINQLLKEMKDALLQKDVCQTKMVEYATKAMEQQEKKSLLYQERIFSLLDRVAAYQDATSTDSCNDIYRLN